MALATAELKIGPFPAGVRTGTYDEGVTAPRWWEPRFEGAVVRDRLPPGFLDLLRHRARRLGLHIIETPAAPPTHYRDSAAPLRALELDQTEAFVGSWDRLRLWQDGEGTLRFEGSFRRWRNHLLVAWLVFAAAYGGLLFSCPSWWGWAMGSWLFFWFLPVHARHRRQARAWVEALVTEELRAAEDAAHRDEVAAAGASAEAAAAPRVAISTEAPVLVAREHVRSTVLQAHVRVADPTLAVAARTSRDAQLDRPESAPEDQVAAIEADFTRRGR
jgi:hypothetical protein